MKACKDVCPVLKVQRCCFLCDKRNECDEVCNQDTHEGCELLVDLPEEMTCEQEAEPILEKLEQIRLPIPNSVPNPRIPKPISSVNC